MTDSLSEILPTPPRELVPKPPPRAPPMSPGWATAEATGLFSAAATDPNACVCGGVHDSHCGKCGEPYHVACPKMCGCDTGVESVDWSRVGLWDYVERRAPPPSPPTQTFETLGKRLRPAEDASKNGDSPPGKQRILRSTPAKKKTLVPYKVLNDFSARLDEEQLQERITQLEAEVSGDASSSSSSSVDSDVDDNVDDDDDDKGTTQTRTKAPTRTRTRTKTTRKRQQQKCGKCGKRGHNRRSCKNHAAGAGGAGSGDEASSDNESSFDFDPAFYVGALKHVRVGIGRHGGSIPDAHSERIKKELAKIADMLE